MNFSFGNGGDNTGIVKNISVVNNIINSESTGVIFACLGAQDSKEISIYNNKIKWKHLGNEISYHGIVENACTANLKFFDNEVECEAQDGSSGYLYNFATNTEFYNNIIDINIGIVSLSNDKGNAFRNNIINLNSDINFLYDGYEFINNTVNINGEIGKIIKSTPTIFRFYSKAVNNNIKITDNKISINCKNSYPISIYFIYNSNLNNYEVDFSNNIINTNIKIKQQELIHLQSLLDLTQQRIYLNNSRNDDYNKIVFYENTINPIIIANEKKFTSSKKIDNFYLE